jgi:hypothetical protein
LLFGTLVGLGGAALAKKAFTHPSSLWIFRYFGRGTPEIMVKHEEKILRMYALLYFNLKDWYFLFLKSGWQGMHHIEFLSSLTIWCNGL